MLPSSEQAVQLCTCNAYQPSRTLRTVQRWLVMVSKTLSYAASMIQGRLQEVAVRPKPSHISASGPFSVVVAQYWLAATENILLKH